MTESSMYSLIETQRCDGIATLCLNDPPANTLTYDLVEQLELAFIHALLDPTVKTIVLTGKGERFFSGGVNIGMLCHATRNFNSNFVLYAAEVFDLIARSSKPLIAAINGHATGGGLELALLAQQRIAIAGDYNIGLPEVRLGVIPGLGGTQRLSRLVGVDAALELITQARFVTPDQALTLGIVDEVVPVTALAESLAHAARQLADVMDGESSHDFTALEFIAYSNVRLDCVGGVGVISLSDDGARPTLLCTLASLNAALLAARKNEGIHVLLFHVVNEMATDSAEGTTPVVMQMLTDYVLERVANYPGICVYYSEQPLSEFHARLARACDFRFVAHAEHATAFYTSEPVHTAPRFKTLTQANPRAWLIDWCTRFAPPLGASRAIGYAKLAIKNGFHLPLGSAQFLERQLQESLLSSPDGQHGMQAYMAKRVPEFKGE